MPNLTEFDAIAKMEREVRREAQKLSVDHQFTPLVLLENTPEAFATCLGPKERALLRPGLRAVDLGAAPGGWRDYGIVVVG